MHRPLSITRNPAFRATAFLGLVMLGLIGLAGCDGVGAPGLLGDCPPGDNCNGPVPPVPVVSPEHVTAQVGTAVTISAVAPNVAAGQVTWQWFRSSDGGVHFDAIAGATGATLSIPSVNLGDDGAIVEAVAIANGLPGSAVSHLAVTAKPPLVYADGEFPTAGWLATAFSDGVASAPTHTEQLVATGGHPGAWRKMILQFAPQAATGIVGYTSVDNTYEPRTQGAVYLIDYAEDAISLEPSSVKTTRSALLLEQAGRRYIAMSTDSFLRLPTVWDVGADTSGLGARDFTLRDGPACQAGESCPDFSSQGAPMRFGYWRDSFGPPGASISHGIDNWTVTVWRR